VPENDGNRARPRRPLTEPLYPHSFLDIWYRETPAGNPNRGGENGR